MIKDQSKAIKDLSISCEWGEAYKHHPLTLQAADDTRTANDTEGLHPMGSPVLDYSPKLGQHS